MNEDAKLNEASYFLIQMTANEDNPHAFAHNLSAFLSAARSTTQYAMEEAKTKPGGMAWYNSQVARDRRPVVGFLKDQRDTSVHVKPVGPKRIIHVEAVTTLYISGSADVSVKYFDSEGKAIEIYTPPAPTQPVEAPVQAYQPAAPSVRYEFNDWAGDEDILTLCNEYLRQLREIVADGRSQGFVS